jgi:NADH:ubiquinone oxidoreductase subunit 6 (subunit J)
MLNIKLADLKYERLNYIPLVSVFALIFITETCMFLYSDYTSLTSSSVYQVYFLADFTQLNLFDSNFMSVFSSSTNMASLAQLLFNDFYTHFLIAGMILLLAMIAAIVSTLNKRFIAKSQIVYNQVLRSFDSSIVHF